MKKTSTKVKRLLEEMYFGTYGLEDLKSLPYMKRKYMIEHIDKMIVKLNLLYDKEGQKYMMFGTGLYKFKKQDIEEIKKMVVK